MKTVYIHYGDDEFKTPNPVKNREYFTKPHGGLWASRKNDRNGWKNWCESEEFRLEQFDKYFEFALKDNSRVLILEREEQLQSLPVIKTLSERWALFDTEYHLDFEKLMDEYDAVEVTDIHNLYWPLYGWDCNSILIMNPDIVQVIDKKDGS